QRPGSRPLASGQRQSCRRRAGQGNLSALPGPRALPRLGAGSQRAARRLGRDDPPRARQDAPRRQGRSGGGGLGWDDARAFNEATTAVKALIVRLAEVAGAEIREHPVWPGAASTVREAEPMTGIRAALAAHLAAAAAARHYIAEARADGMTW